MRGINKHLTAYLLLLAILLPINSVLAQVAPQGNQWFIKAKPCWANGYQVEKNLTIALHSVVDITDFSHARFRIAVASCYKLYVNGEFIGYGPSIAALGYFRVDEFDFTKNLKKGKNILAIEVVGYNVDNYFIPNQPSFVQAELVIDDMVVAATLTGDKKEAFEMAIPNQRIQDVPKFSFQRPYSEYYNLEHSYDSWKTSDTIGFIKINVEETDKKNLLPRRVKYPDYSFKKFKQKLPNDIYEFDKDYTGFIVSRLIVRKPSKIILSWDEILVNNDIQKGRLGYNSFVKYNLKPGEYTLETFDPYTMKFLKLSVEEGDCEIKELKIKQYVNSDISKAKFTTNDTVLNKIFDAAIETHKQCAIDVFMDCPSRERAGWLCDSYFSARVAYILSGNTLIERNFLENYLLPDNFPNIPEGMLPMCYPANHTNGNFIPNWALWFIFELDEYVARSGDYEMLVALKPKILSLLKYFEQFKNEDGLLERLDKWVFVEWSKANDFVQDVNYPSNMLYARALEITGRLYNIPALQAESAKIKNGIQKQSYVNGFFADNAIRENGKLVVQKQNQSEVCQYYAFYFGTATSQQYPELWQKLVRDFGAKRDYTKVYPNIFPANSFVGNYLRLELLSKEGLTSQLVEECKDQFSHMADLSGTLWENTYPGSSCCHGFASHVAYVFYRDIAGFAKIDQINKKIFIQFNETDLNNCIATIPIGDDQVSIKWQKKGKILVYDLKIPDNYKVEIHNNTNLKLLQIER